MPSNAETIIKWCEFGGTVGDTLTGWVAQGPFWLWLVYLGMCLQRNELYYVVMSQFYLISSGVIFILARLSPWATIQDGVTCVSEDFWGPSLSMMLITHYLVATSLDRWFWHQPMRWINDATTFALVVFVPVWLAISGNESVTQLAQGALVGLASGVVLQYLLIFFLLPRMPYLCEILHYVWGINHDPDVMANSEKEPDT